MSTDSIGGLNYGLGVALAVARRVILIVASVEGALLPTMVLAAVAVGTELLKSWSPAALATTPLLPQQLDCGALV
jgi:hypothetical protein